MKFSEKLSKVLNANKLGVDTPSGLEEFIGASTGSITKPLSKKAAPGPKIQKKIVEKLRINPDWWETGEGSIFAGEQSNSQEQIKTMPLDTWEELKRTNGHLIKTADHDQKVMDDLLEVIKGFQKTINTHKI